MRRSITIFLLTLLLGGAALGGQGHAAEESAMPGGALENGSSGELPSYGEAEERTIIEATHEQVSVARRRLV